MEEIHLENGDHIDNHSNRRKGKLNGYLNGHMNGNKTSHKQKKLDEHTPADSLHNRPLDHIVMSNPRLFVRPAYWTKQHASILCAAYKEDKSMPLLFPPQCLDQELEAKASMQQPGFSRVTPSDLLPAAGEILRLPQLLSPFQLPKLPYPRMTSHTDQLRSNAAQADAYLSKTQAMDGLLLKQQQQQKIARILNLVQDLLTGPSQDEFGELSSRSIPLSITYGKKAIPILVESRYYMFADDNHHHRNDAWRLFYLDRSQLNQGPWTKIKKTRHRKMIQKLGIAGTERATAGGGLSQWSAAALFISIAQARQRDVEETKKTTEKPGHSTTTMPSSEPRPQPQPRYQILFTENGESDSSGIHLYTAQVSEFLLEHFGTPARIPPTGPSDKSSRLLKIHHTVIPFSPFRSFRRRLRIAIMHYANGTAGGFFKG
ncbi:hypothetical protein F5Y14DRAFT_458931 [Nemania sp. NC0429]|nr:hypothetical protein F5Y14DRAFT_458931 [Nemania sp. NC0429]